MKMTEEQKENWELVRQDLLADLAEKRHNHPKPTHIDVEVVVSVTLRVQVPLEPGDLILFNDRGRGRVSHAGIYLGDDQFIHSSSSRSG